MDNDCPMCEQPNPECLGTLGQRIWFRCKYCWCEFSWKPASKELIRL